MKFKQTLVMQSTYICCVEKCQNHNTEWHHIFGRSATLVDEERNLVEICQPHHINHSKQEIFINICATQITKYGAEWITWAIPVAREQGKFKELQILLTLEDNHALFSIKK